MLVIRKTAEGTGAQIQELGKLSWQDFYKNILVKVWVFFLMFINNKNKRGYQNHQVF